MRVLLVSRFAIMGTYQRWLETLAACMQGELVVIIPPYWRATGGQIERLIDRHTHGYQLIVTPIRHNGSATRHYYPHLGQLLASIRPDLLHLDSCAEQAATTHGIRLAIRAGIPAIFHMERRSDRRRSPLHWWREHYTYTHARGAIVDDLDTQTILRHRGWHGPTAIIPYHDLHPDRFALLAQEIYAFYASCC
jgi:hypothetical protein